MAPLAQKDQVQATIVRKLSSYAQRKQTKKAQWELENFRPTIRVLDIIDNPVLRQSIQKALNRGEAYHRMRWAIPLPAYSEPALRIETVRFVVTARHLGSFFLWPRASGRLADRLHIGQTARGQRRVWKLSILLRK